MKKIALLGSTGSIGVQVLNIVSRHPDLFSIVSLAAGNNARLFSHQVKTFRPAVAALANEEAFLSVKEDLPTGVEYFTGEDAVLSAIVKEADVVFVSVVGFLGLKCVLKAIEYKKPIALANKESLCAGGELVMARAKAAGVPIIPVDSEHSAIWQCLAFDSQKTCEKIVLTASGGPFWKLPKEEFSTITKARALAHPTWNMGAKITIDSATLANKGLEIMEAHHLFSAPLEKIDVVLHPESIVHSMATFSDGAMIAELSYPSMEIPIQLALTYPNRIPSGVAQLDLPKLSALHFHPVPEEKFPCFTLAKQALKAGGVMPCVYSAANEAAVEAFLAERIAFCEISDYIALALEKIPNTTPNDYDILSQTALTATAIVRSAIGDKLCP